MKTKILKRMRSRLIIVPTGNPRGAFYHVFKKDFSRQQICSSVGEIIDSFFDVLGLGIGTWFAYTKRRSARANKNDFKKLSA